MKLPVLSWIVCVLALIGLLAWGGTRVVAVAPDRPTVATGTALIGGAFTLVDGKGKGWTDKDFRGRYALVYFGFTHCPDICPTTLLTIANALTQINKPKRIVPVFITLDPERDTPKAVTDYVAHFGDAFIGLSGTPAQIKQAADAYKVYYTKVEQPGSAMEYVIDHSGFVYLMGPDGQYVTHVAHGISEQALTEKLNAAIK